ncbi:hypothetical protein GCM10010230_34500 [Streptomyces narbonensis]|nr:hypothetical protein GCM10010230_34500 [Streptomyces narbonensis]
MSEISETANETRTCRRTRPLERSGFFVSPVQAAAEDTRFELVRGCPQHAFQMFVRGSGRGRRCPDLLRSLCIASVRTAPDGGERNQNCNQDSDGSGVGEGRRDGWNSADA